MEVHLTVYLTITVIVLLALGSNSEEVGTTSVYVNGDGTECRLRECTMGNVVTDAMVYAFRDRADVKMALMHGGGIRGSFDDKTNGGSISKEDVARVLPFQDYIDILEITGATLRETFEFCAAGYDAYAEDPSGKFLQMSGINVVYDFEGEEGKRIVTLTILCGDCADEKYVGVDETANYKVAVPSWIATGGDGFTLGDNAVSREETGIPDTDMLEEYLKDNSPITHETEGRIVDFNEGGII